MTILRSRPPVKTDAEKLAEAREEIARLRAQVLETASERDVLQAQLEKDPLRATWWLQGKVWRQRQALDRLHTRVVTQRLILHAMHSLGRDLSREEWQAALAELDNPEVRARIEQDLK